ncbi:MAG: hypothetical protein EKK53_15400 [Burkholderiales bacterium]|nr:MAG: hypothetical protein EKK53_15400 [Burkholderiales bacterium]
MADSIDPRDFGRLEAKVETLEMLVAEQTETLKRMADRLEAMSELLSQARGGWRTLMWVGGAVATVASAITWAINHLALKP